MSTEPAIQEAIERAAESVGATWPLHSFVTANPLAGFEDRPFDQAVQAGERLFGARGYPSVDVFRRAWETGRIDPEILSTTLAEHGYDDDPETLLDRMAAANGASDPESKPETETATNGVTPETRVDAVLSKWLAAFVDEGQTDWSLPNRERGFYAAVRGVARYDRRLPDRTAMAALPDDPVDAIAAVLADRPTDRWEAIFEYHLAALPGWTGVIKHRIMADGEWQSRYPVTLAGYLAIRLALADQFDAPITPPDVDGAADGHAVGRTDGARGHPRSRTETDDDVPLAEVWLAAWEATYREELVAAVADAGRARSAPPGEAEAATDEADDGRPAAQLVFCIDTRSEVIRRHVEQVGPYETHGYAGFFGIPMRYEGYGTDVAVDACPPILDAKHRVAERPADDHEARRSDHDLWAGLGRAGRELLHTLETNPGTAFSFVESAGSGYGLALAARTLLPTRVYDALSAADDRVPDVHEFCAPTVDHDPAADGDLPLGLTLDEQIEYAATAFDLMGWDEFARVVALIGHASQTANNPFASSLDCGACAGNPGGPNARLLAAICNRPAVREALRERGHEIPADTVFVAGEHNTTTDEITLYDGDVPASHTAEIDRLRGALETARTGAAAERAGGVETTPGEGVRETERRAADWAETRPEWGLAGNAAFVIGPRPLTADLNLDARAFLHSYDPANDPDGAALAAIMTGPMVVTQWINSQYYFATVDTAVYGSGSKITQNPVGNVGVHQGNGGDLMTGLPLQSVAATDDAPYHQPLRLSVVIAAPVDRVTEILAAHEDLRGLLDNGWLSLAVVDPEQAYRVVHYDGDLTWTDDGVETATADSAPVTTPPAED